MTERNLPSRFSVLPGLLVSIALFAGSIWALVGEIQGLFQSLEAQNVLIHFNADTGFFVGVVIGCVALAGICIGPVIGRMFSANVYTFLNLLFVVAVVVGIAGRLLGSMLVSSYLEDHNYSYCREQSTIEPRFRKQAWVLDELLCDVPFDIEGMTLPELKEMLADQ